MQTPSVFGFLLRAAPPGQLRVRLARVCAVTLALTAAAAAAHYFRVGQRYCRPARQHLTAAERERAHRALPLLEDVAFRADDGLTIRGFYLAPKNGVVVVMGHGIAENRMRFLPDAEMLAGSGYGALFFDWPGHGESDERAGTWGDHEQRDFRAAIDFATQKAGSGVKIAALGFSVGSSAVALEAADDPRVRAVILEAIWPTLDEEMSDKIPYFFKRWPARLGMRREGVEFDRVRPIDVIDRIAPRPLLIVAGAADRDTPLPVVERVFTAAKEPKQIWVVPGADHGKYFDTQPEEYRRTVMTFLDGAFPGR